MTVMDPFQIKYGKVPTAALSLASLISEIMWVTGTLIGLGKNVSLCGRDAFDTSYVDLGSRAVADRSSLPRC